MTKNEFLEKLKNGLSSLPENDLNERISFYSEMIDDRIEEGLNEEKAVAGVGNIEEIISQTINDNTLPKEDNQISEQEPIEKKPKRKLKAWEIVLIIVGFPLWFPLLMALFAVAISFYIVIWALVLCIFAIALSLLAGAVYSIVSTIILLIQGNIPSALIYLGLCMVCAGLTILFIYLFILAGKGMFKFSRWIHERYMKRKGKKA